MFAIHSPVIANTFKVLSLKTFPLYGFWYLFRKITISLMLVFISTGLGMLAKQIMPPVFAVLNGGRKIKKGETK